MSSTGLVFNIQRFCIHDGPGIRTTVFLKGCPLRCWWCHNPEGQSPEPELRLIHARCVHCGRCRQVCPQHAAGATGGNGHASSARSGCTLCGECVRVCPTEARQMIGRRMSVEQVLAEVLKDRIFYDESGGGVTFSGGEPLMQAPFLAGLLRACRAEGVHTALDTCGFGPREDLLELAELSDLVLYDLKSLDDQRHREHTGASNAEILDNLQALAERHANIWVRVPVVPGLNDGADQLEAMARFVSTLKGVRQVNLLGYHALGTHKRPSIGREGSHEGSPAGEEEARPAPTPPQPEQLDQAAERFRRLGLTAYVGG